jgi:hypothetical protein
LKPAADKAPLHGLVKKVAKSISRVPDKHGPHNCVMFPPNSIVNCAGEERKGWDKRFVGDWNVLNSIGN